MNLRNVWSICITSLMSFSRKVHLVWFGLCNRASLFRWLL
ncbi:hypothetical protein LINPERPRIM_LOCUS19012 [Linum perenne]